MQTGPVSSTETPLKLFHFTAIEHLSHIVRSGALQTTESNIGSGSPEWSPHGEHVGPDVLWCFDTPEPEGARKMLTTVRRTSRGSQRVSKLLVRFSLAVPDEDVVSWLPWARDQRIHPQWLAALSKDQRPDTWRCVLRGVPEAEWAEVEWRSSERGAWQPVAYGSGVVLDPRV